MDAPGMGTAGMDTAGMDTAGMDTEGMDTEARARAGRGEVARPDAAGGDPGADVAGGVDVAAGAEVAAGVDVAAGADVAGGGARALVPGQSGPRRGASTAVTRATEPRPGHRPPGATWPMLPGEYPVLAAAREYGRHGWHVVPLAVRSKNPSGGYGWQHRRLDDASLARHLTWRSNVGLITGHASGGLLDVDCDAPEAIAAAAALLPATGLVHGRAGKPASHYWYVLDNDETTHPAADTRATPPGATVALVHTVRYVYIEVAPAPTAASTSARPSPHPSRPVSAGRSTPPAPTVLVELRGDNCQTMVPPSVHPCGEVLRWEHWGAPGRVRLAVLRRAVARVAACALLARHWPDVGARDEAALALTGLLLRGGWTPGEADHFVTLTARIAGDDEWAKRAKGRATAARLAERRPVTGAGTLVERLRDGARVVAQARRWLALDDGGGPGGGGRRDRDRYLPLGLPLEDDALWRPGADPWRGPGSAGHQEGHQGAREDAPEDAREDAREDGHEADRQASRQDDGRGDAGRDLNDLADADDAVGTLLSAYRPRPVERLWGGRLYPGKLTLFDGDPGCGKTLIALDLAARITAGLALPGDDNPEVGRGDDPDDARAPGGVVYFTAEDDPADTLRPRLEAAGGDPARLLVVTTIRETDDEGRTRERLPTFRDLAVIARAIARVHARLVVFDPFMAYLDRETSSFRDQDVRAVLTPLARVAARTGAAFLLIRHLNKAVGGSALYRGGGSIGIIGAARSGLLAARDPDDPARCVLASVKNNLGPPPPALAYSITSTTLTGAGQRDAGPTENTAAGSPTGGYTEGADDTGPFTAPRVIWHGTSAHAADALLAPAGLGRGEEASPSLERATTLLAELLADGPMREEDVRRTALAAGVALPSLRRAKLALGVVSARTPGFGAAGCWRWALPPSAPAGTSAADAHVPCPPRETGAPRETGDPAPGPKDDHGEVKGDHLPGMITFGPGVITFGDGVSALPAPAAMSDLPPDCPEGGRHWFVARDEAGPKRCLHCGRAEGGGQGGGATGQAGDLTWAGGSLGADAELKFRV